MWVGQQTGALLRYQISEISRFAGDAGSQRRNASKNAFHRVALDWLHPTVLFETRDGEMTNEENQRWAYDCGQEACRQDGGWTRSHQEPQGGSKDHEDIRSRSPIWTRSCGYFQRSRAVPTSRSPGVEIDARILSVSQSVTPRKPTARRDKAARAGSMIHCSTVTGYLYNYIPSASSVRRRSNKDSLACSDASVLLPWRQNRRPGCKT